MNKETRQMIVGLLMFGFSFIVILIAIVAIKDGSAKWHTYLGLAGNTCAIWYAFSLIQKSVK